MMKFVVDRMLEVSKTIKNAGYDALYYRGEDVYPLIRLASGRTGHCNSKHQSHSRRPEDVILRIAEDELAPV